ncbi:MAG: class I SAM-dependent methyltransferase [Alphaproteobacteria bacterium]|nr:class I SAM-dependent methyltransferase [Alphaproteobacteria bacterium]
MREPYAHPVMPRANHDELARQNAVASIKIYMEDHVYPADKAVYERRVKPAFVRSNGRPPKDKHEVRKLMEREPTYQMWSSVARTLQEMLWDNVGACVERQLPDLIEKCRVTKPKGSLRLNPTLTIPRYNGAIDIHCMPGGYHADLTQDDVYAGALFDRGAHYYGVPIMGSPAHQVRDGAGGTWKQRTAQLCLGTIRRYYPNLRPKRILDVGCTIGGSTLAFCSAYPDAQVYGVDIAAPSLRYAHARAEAMANVVHFSQQNAEQLDFPDGSFDLVISHGLFHETSGKATRNILRECYRVLRPGGVTLHYDTQFSRGLDPHDSFMHDWDTYYNNEPFWGPLHETPVVTLMTEAGFKASDVHAC